MHLMLSERDTSKKNSKNRKMAGNGSLYDVMFVKCGYLIMKKTLHEYLYNENKE